MTQICPLCPTQVPPPWGAPWLSTPRSSQPSPGEGLGQQVQLPHFRAGRWVWPPGWDSQRETGNRAGGTGQGWGLRCRMPEMLPDPQAARQQAGEEGTQGLGTQRDQGTQPRSHSSWRQWVNPGVRVPRAHIHTQPTGLYLAPMLFLTASQPLPGCSITGHRDHRGARHPPVPTPSPGLSTPWGAQFPPGTPPALPIPG